MTAPRLVVLGLALLVVRGARAQAPGEAARPLATVSVAAQRPGTVIPRDFIGYSLEVSTAGQGIGAFQGPNAAGGAGAAEQSVYALG